MSDSENVPKVCTKDTLVLCECPYCKKVQRVRIILEGMTTCDEKTPESQPIQGIYNLG